MKNDFVIEQARLGERAVDDDDRAAVDALAVDDAAFLAALPPALMAAKITAAAKARSSSSSSSWRRWLALAALPTVATASLALLVLRPTTADEDVEVITSKGGGPVLVASRITSAGTEALFDGAAVAAGDVVQLGWLAPSTSMSVQGMVVSIDGRGAVTRHLPLSASAAAPTLASKGSLPSSYELDDAPLFERFFLVTGDSIDVAAVMKAADALAHSPSASSAPLLLPSTWSVSALLVRK